MSKYYFTVEYTASVRLQYVPDRKQTAPLYVSLSSYIAGQHLPPAHGFPIVVVAYEKQKAM